jgi:Galactose oxidase, central domain/Kelch motif
MKTRLLLLYVVGITSMAMFAQTPGTFTATGSMTTPRTDHTATLLENGKVLIAGGHQNVFPTNTVASAEIYDPATGTFTPTGSMTEARANHTATLLPDGRVLIAGGNNNTTASIASAEIYDPSTGIFTATGTMVANPFTFGNSATLLQDGRVFIGSYPAAQIYDPVSGTFSYTAPYAQQPEDIEAAVLRADGLVLLTGSIGNPSGPPEGPLSELYDPVGDTYLLPFNTIDIWLDVYTGTLLPNASVLFVGNSDGDGTPADVDVYQPSADAFTRAGSALQNHEFGASTLLPDGTVLFTGGQLPGGNGETVSELYESNATFSATGNMVTGRHEHTSTLLADGTVLIAGGYSIWPSGTSSAELYHPAAVVPSPELFPISGSQGAIWHTDTGQIVSPENPATAGEPLAMYTDRLIEGSLIPPQVAVGGRVAGIIFFGDAPDYPGYFQVNFRMPSAVAPGSAVQVRLSYLGRPSNAVTIAVQ